MKQVVLVAALMFAAAQLASASIILVSPIPFSGSGIGTVNTILTVQNIGAESGCVSFIGGVQVIGGAGCFGGNVGGNESTGASQTQSRTITQTSAISAADLRIVLNANQLASGPITLADLDVAFFSPTGTLLYTASLAAPVNFPSTFSGIGNSGFIFALDASQAAGAQAAGAFSNVNNRVGLAATLTGANAGPETFFITSQSAVGTPIPEPSTFLLLSGAIIVLGLYRGGPLK